MYAGSNQWGFPVDDRHHRPKRWIMTLLVIVGIVVVIDYVFLDTWALGATTRFLWNALIFAALWFLRAAEGFILLFSKRRVVKFTSFLTNVGLGYASRVVLTETQAKKAFTWKYWVAQNTREKVRIALSYVRVRWIKLETWQKFAIVAILITVQVLWVPFAVLFVIFPVGFMVPFIIAMRQMIVAVVVGLLADSALSRTYWNYFGHMHRSLVQRSKSVPVVREVRGAMYLTRLQYLTAWRMWMHAECYKTTKGRRRISLFEPLRLWWRGELNTYIGRPLLSGKCNPWPERAYVLPKLWYEHDTPWSRLGMILVAFFLIATSMRGSARSR